MPAIATCDCAIFRDGAPVASMVVRVWVRHVVTHLAAYLTVSCTREMVMRSAATLAPPPAFPGLFRRTRRRSEQRRAVRSATEDDAARLLKSQRATNRSRCTEPTARDGVHGQVSREDSSMQAVVRRIVTGGLV